MEFRLVYAGELLRSAGNKKSRFWEKHEIRKYLHKQLKTLWRTHPVLAFYAEPEHQEMGGFVISTVDHESTQVDTIAKRYEGLFQ